VTDEIRWGFIGTGLMARVFAEGLSDLPEARLVAVGSRTRAAAEAFGEQFGVPHRHSSYAALVNDPAVILADEPTGNLDSVSTEQIISVFRDLNQEGITVVLVTHEMDVAEQTRRIIRLHDGEIASDEKVAKKTSG